MACDRRLHCRANSVGASDPLIAARLKTIAHDEQQLEPVRDFVVADYPDASDVRSRPYALKLFANCFHRVRAEPVSEIDD